MNNTSSSKILILFALVAFATATQYLTDYNGIIFGAMFSYSSDTEGRLAIGGSARLQNYAVGTALSQDCTRVDLQIGGAFVGQDGQVTRGKATAYGDISIVNWNTPCGPIDQVPLSIDMVTAQSELTSESVQLNGEAANGASTLSFTTLSLTGTNTFVNYFTVDGSTVASLTGINIDIPQGSWAVINYQGDNIEFRSMAFVLSATTNRQKVLHNFATATTIKVEQVTFEGSILAPHAGLTYNYGEIRGSLACANYFGTGQLHNYPYIPPNSPPTCECSPCEETITLPSCFLFSLYIQKDITAAATDFQGRVAAGGDVNFNFVAVGSHLPSNDDDNLIVKGDLFYHDGQVYQGNGVVQGSINVERVSFPNGQLLNERVNIPFYLEFVTLHITSELISWWPCTGEAILNYSTLDLYGSDWFLNVFTIDYTTLEAARTIVLSVPYHSHVIINVDGSNVNFANAGIVLNGFNPARILWNFFNTESLVMNSIQIEGSVLAPLANVSFNNGNLVGAIFARSYSGNGEIHIASWIPLPVPCEPCNC